VNGLSGSKPGIFEDTVNALAVSCPIFICLLTAAAFADVMFCACDAEPLVTVTAPIEEAEQVTRKAENHLSVLTLFMFSLLLLIICFFYS